MARPRQDWGITDALLVRRYESGETIYQLAEALGRSVNGVYKRLKSAGVSEFRKNLNPPAMPGEEHPRWRGGRSVGYRRARSGNWKEQRRLALERDEYACQDCGATERLVVHHDGDPSDHDLAGLRTLCSSCHIKLHRPGDVRWGKRGR